ncbi:MAG: hypothetical protein ACE15F_23490 [bacterium]
MFDRMVWIFYQVILAKEGQPYRPGEGPVMPKFLTPTDIDPKVLLWLLGTLTVTIAVIVYVTYRYNRWVKYKEFESEMKALDLDTGSEGALAEMVRRHNLNEPVNILFSASMFDEMAAEEIRRILGSTASAQQKQERIDTLYNIRTKTYHPDWLILPRRADRPPTKRPA